MNYYTKEEPIVLREYGKSIQSYINLCIAEPNKEKRTIIAYAIVDFMAQLTPQVKATSDYRKKLWDHLFFIADYKLDVDAPYEIAEKDVIVPTPAKMYYPKFGSPFKHYGKYIVEFINFAKDFEEDKRKVMARPIASYMKLVHKTWNNEVVNDSIVKNDLFNISKGMLDMPEDETIKQLLPKNKMTNNPNFKNKNKNKNKNNRNKGNQNYQNNKK